MTRIPDKLVGVLIGLPAAMLLSSCSPQAPPPREDIGCQHPQGSDLDCDGLSDRIEMMLLEKYRPYLRFSTNTIAGSTSDEGERPTDPLWYIRHSELLTDGDEDSTPVVDQTELAATPLKVLTNTPDFGSSSLVVKKCRNNYFINPSNEYRSGWHKNDGYDWPAILASGKIGLYGHVSRHPTIPNTYQLEYWQFFGYNNAHNNEIADHEGDWALLTVDVNTTYDIVAVTHWSHGKALSFATALAVGAPTYFTDGTGLVKELRGPQYTSEEVDICENTPIVCPGRSGGPERVQNSILRLHCIRNRDACFHPMVYVENGGHEFWPSQYWEFNFAPEHQGESQYRYLTATPPNLGEVNFPMPGVEDANIILAFNGHWGAFGRRNSPPLGPPLHRAWSWSAGKRPALDCLE